MFYELAKRYDEWPGTAYDGSSCRGALKGWQKHGVCSAASWPYTVDAQGAVKFEQPLPVWQADAGSRPLGVYYRIDTASVVDMQAAIVNIGAIYVSGNVHDGWDGLVAGGEPKLPISHASLPTIAKPRDAKALGGHAFALVGFNERGFVVQNSWGVIWGASGFGVLPYADWVEHGSDAWACALGVATQRQPSVSSSSSSALASLSPAGGAHVSASRWRLPVGKSLNSPSVGIDAEGSPVDDPWPVDHDFVCSAYKPWSTGDAYGHLLLTDEDGQLIVNDIARSADDRAGLAHDLIVNRPLAWLAGMRKAPKVLKVVLIFDGGLNNETDIIKRVRTLGPYFEANGIIPIFVAWRTGVGLTLDAQLPEWSRKLFGVLRTGPVDAGDRALEAQARLLGRGLWKGQHAAPSGLVTGSATGRATGSTSDWESTSSSAFASASASASLSSSPPASASASASRSTSTSTSTLSLLAANIHELHEAAASKDKRLELHIIAHSAGAITAGLLLDDIVSGASASTPEAETRPPLKVHTCTLFAPACSVRFGIDHYLKAADAGCMDLKKLFIEVLSHHNEKRDGIPSSSVPGMTRATAAYGKSLLYLVSRALEDQRKMPMLGMDRALDLSFANPEYWAASEVETISAWMSRWPHAATATRGSLLKIVTRPQIRVNIEDELQPSTHDSFFHSLEAMTEALLRIKGTPLVAAIEWLDY